MTNFHFRLVPAKRPASLAALWYLIFLCLLSCAGISIEPTDPNSQNAPPQVTEEAVKGWLLACSGVLWESNLERFDTLAGQNINDITINNEKKLLSEWWDIKDRDSFLKSLDWAAKDGGHRKHFEQDGQRVSSLCDEEFSDLLKTYKNDRGKQNDLIMARWYYKELGEKSLIGWDYCRYICLCRWGVLCGYIDEKTAWTNLISAGRKLQETFDSWEDLGQNYLIGRRYWSLAQTRQNGDRYEDAFDRLVQLPSSPWNRYPWNLDLTDAEKILNEQAAEPVSSPAESENESGDIPSFVNAPRITVVNHISDYTAAGKVRIVPDDYKTIQAALDAAEPNDTVFIKEGIYQEDVLLNTKNGIRIAGEQMDKVVLCATTEKQESILRIHGSNDIVVCDLTVKVNAQTQLPGKKGGICVSQGTVDILRCRIHDTKDNGILYFLGAKGNIKECVLENNSKNGIILLSPGTSAMISNCRISNNKWYGIEVVSQAEGILEKNVCQSSFSAGIFAAEKGTRVTCVENYLYENGGQGIMIKEGAAGLMKANVCRNNKAEGIAVVVNSIDVILQNNICRSNGNSGIKFYDHASGFIEGCICENNQRDGITVFCKGTQATLIRNRCVGNTLNGIFVSECTVDRIEDNICTDNLDNGIYMDTMEGEALLKGNFCERNFTRGIAVCDTDARLYNNTCRNNQDNGMLLWGQKGIFIARDNHLVSNLEAGISVQKVRKAEIKNNVCENNIDAGVEIYGKSGSVTVLENQCDKNYPNGISFEDGAGGYAGKNTCRQNAWAGIAVGGRKTHPFIEDNTCSGGQWGILVWANPGCGWGIDNRTAENTGAGIKIR